MPLATGADVLAAAVKEPRSEDARLDERNVDEITCTTKQTPAADPCLCQEGAAHLNLCELSASGSRSGTSKASQLLQLCEPEGYD